MYSLNWKAEGESCLVIGAGHVALRKIRGLLEAGARVTVIAPEAEADIEKLSEEGKSGICGSPMRRGTKKAAGWSFPHAASAASRKSSIS